MKNEQLYLILGSAFLIASGLIFTLERMITWGTELSTGTWSTFPESSFFSNLFVSLFLLLGIVFFVLFFRINNNEIR